MPDGSKHLVDAPKLASQYLLTPVRNWFWSWSRFAPTRALQLKSAVYRCSQIWLILLSNIWHNQNAISFLFPFWYAHRNALLCKYWFKILRYYYRHLLRITLFFCVHIFRMFGSLYTQICFVSNTKIKRRLILHRSALNKGS